MWLILKMPKKKVAELQKKADRDKKRREKEGADNQELAGGETMKVMDEEINGYEIWVCEWLVTYFKSISGVKDLVDTSPTKVATSSAQSKIDEDIKKGIIKVLDRDTKFDDFSIGLSGQTAGKKKSKAPKVSKRDQKFESSNILNLDLTIIKKIKDVGLNPPVKKDEVPTFLHQVAKTQAEYKLQQENKKKGIYTTPVHHVTVVEESKTKERPKKVVRDLEEEVTKTTETIISTPNTETTTTTTVTHSVPVTHGGVEEFENSSTMTSTTKVTETHTTTKHESPQIEHISEIKTTTIVTKEDIEQEYEEVEITEEIEEEVEITEEEVVEAPEK